MWRLERWSLSSQALRDLPGFGGLGGESITFLIFPGIDMKEVK